MQKWPQLFIRSVATLLLGALITTGHLRLPIAAPVRAATTDTGTITITGAVPPSATSITTHLQAAGDSPSPQNAELTYTLSYSSNNTAAIPLTLKVAWPKGLIEGASEPSVALLDYVVGSASVGYGEALPIVDSQKHTITWAIAALPADGQTRTVSFKLRTTDSYTGNQKVNFTVKAYVVSPVGAPDRSVTRQYQYVPPVTSSAADPTVSPLPTALVTGTTTRADQIPANTFQTIAVQSLGAISARLNVQIAQPAALSLQYGLTPTALTNKLVQPADPNVTVQQFVLVGLQPATRYYYQIITLSEPAIKSDIFTFETASQLAAASATQPMGVTMTQDRTILYSGQSAVSAQEVTQPMVVNKNTVVDLSLNIPKSQPIKLVEVLIRNFSVLGVSTEHLTVDELQSTTTQMTAITPDVYVGKLRTPTVSGTYQVVSRVEDNYGNITEQEIGAMQVVSPFTILDAKTQQPLEQAQVTLAVYNPKTQLYEPLSNVTTTIKNPAFSDANGVVALSLFPGQYQAEVTLPGYITQQVTFTIGATANGASMPQVALQPDSKLLGGQVTYILGMLGHIFTTQAELYQTLAQSDRMFQLIFSLGVALFALSASYALVLYRCPQLNPLRWLQQPYPHLWQRGLVILGYALLQLVGFCGEFFVVISLIFGWLFYIQLGPIQGIWVLGLTGLTSALWIFDALFLQSHGHPLKPIRKAQPDSVTPA